MQLNSCNTLREKKWSIEKKRAFKCNKTSNIQSHQNKAEQLCGLPVDFNCYYHELLYSS